MPGPLAIACLTVLIPALQHAASAQISVPTSSATRIASTIVLDGVLDDEAWLTTVPIGPLVQREPVEGGVPSEATEVRVAFDRTTLYFGIACHDRTPSAIVSTQLGRDADLAVDDHIRIVLDPFADQRNGFFFVVNPAGARADGQISNNAREPSVEWDTIWDARTRITPEGWVAEIAIPFTSLRFTPSERVWGLNVERQIKRRQETARWAGARNDVWVTNLSAAGRLTGLKGLPQGRGLDIRPFVPGGKANSDGSLLEMLMQGAGRICGRMSILEKVWDYDFDPGTNLVDVYVRRLREKIDVDGEPRLIHTVRGVGYVMRVEP